MTHHTTESVEQWARLAGANLKPNREFRHKTGATLRDLAAERDALLAAQSYTYIGKDGKPVLARDLEDERDALRARLDEAERAFLWIMEQDQVGSGMIRDEGRFAKRARAFLNGGGNG